MTKVFDVKVELLHATPLWVAADAISNCWDSGHKSDTVLQPTGLIYEDGEPEEDLVCGEQDRALIYRVGNKNKHASTLEHLFYNFKITEVSRAVLQELSRHRIASLSVKSTRYTLKELKAEAPFAEYDGRGVYISDENSKRASKYIVLTEDVDINLRAITALDALREVVAAGKANDVTKYCLPECYKTQLAWSVNGRSLQNFLALRTSKSALLEIRELAHTVFNALPDDHKYLFADFVYSEE